MVFTPNAENILEKHLENEIHVSVGIELVVVDMSREYFRSKKQIFQFENFRVRKLAAINALNFYITLCMAFLAHISMKPVYYSAEYEWNVQSVFDFIIDHMPSQRKPLVK
jgi:hypothetical protein